MKAGVGDGGLMYMVVVAGARVERIGRGSEVCVSLLPGSEVCEAAKEEEGVCFGVSV